MCAKRVRALEVAPQRSRKDSTVAGIQAAIVAALAGSNQNHEGLPQGERIRFARLSHAHDLRGHQSRDPATTRSGEGDLPALRRGGPGLWFRQVVRVDQVRFSSYS